MSDSSFLSLNLCQTNIFVMEDEVIFEPFDIDNIPEPEKIDEVIYSLMVNPNLTPLNYFNDFTDNIPDPVNIGKESTESVFFEVGEGNHIMAMTTHAMHHHLVSDPQKAAEILVSRAARKMVCLGAKPVAVSAMLYHINFSDPNEQFIASGAKVGLENAAKAFGLQLSDRKMRFDFFGEHGNQSPTMIVSLLGSIKSEGNNAAVTLSQSFQKKGNNIFMLGNPTNDIATSDYLEFYHSVSESPLPEFDLSFEKNLVLVVQELINKGYIQSAMPVAKGGVFFTLLRACWQNGLGFDITTAAEVRTDSFLFGEAMGRVIVGVPQETEEEFINFMFDSGIPFFTLGHVTKGEIRIDDVSFGYIDKMSESF
jgi:phosphoribosylformylglycinamidine synthase subunit PurL